MRQVYLLFYLSQARRIARRVSPTVVDLGPRVRVRIATCDTRDYASLSLPPSPMWPSARRASRTAWSRPPTSKRECVR